jgi:hypothetical protein
MGREREREREKRVGCVQWRRTLVHL